jgi:uncharacterized DUF497 family protein
MIDFGLINGFDWDAGNERKSFDKHGISMGEGETGFFCKPETINQIDFSQDASIDAGKNQD